MSNIDIVKQFLQALEKGDTGRVKSLCTSDCEIVGPAAKALTPDELGSVGKALSSGIPDWKFNISDINEDGNEVTVTSRIIGTHTKDLSLPNMPRIPATSKKLRMPEETCTITIESGKIARLELEKVPGGGIDGIVSQLRTVQQPAGR